jgi:hypothetical protein
VPEGFGGGDAAGRVEDEEAAQQVDGGRAGPRKDRGPLDAAAGAVVGTPGGGKAAVGRGGRLESEKLHADTIYHISEYTRAVSIAEGASRARSCGQVKDGLEEAELAATQSGRLESEKLRQGAATDGFTAGIRVITNVGQVAVTENAQPAV